MYRAFTQVWRSLRTDPWYGVSVIVTLGLGIGISTSAFTVVDRLVLRQPGQLLKAEELRRVTRTLLPTQPRASAQRFTSVSYPEFSSIARAVNGIGDVTFYGNWPDAITLRLNGAILRARILDVGVNYFQVLGVAPSLGRFFGAPSPLVAPGASPREAVISDAFWTRAVGRQASAIGATLEVHHQRLKVVGVTPDGFDGIALDGPDIWLPAEFGAAEMSPGAAGVPWERDRNSRPWDVAIRGRVGASEAELVQRMSTALTADAEAAGEPRLFSAVELLTLPRALGPGFDPDRKEIKLAIVLWAVSLVVILIASMNAGSLFLVRGLEQQHNTAMALALGAGRGRVVRERIMEGVILALAGAAVGVVLAKVGSRLIRAAIGRYLHWTDTPIDPRTLLYAAGAAVFIGGIASALPALRATRIELRALLDEGALNSAKDVRRLSAVIHCLQLGFAVIVLYGAALFVLSGKRAAAIPLGMNIENVIVASADLAREGFSEVQIRQFWDRVLGELRAAPPVESVALSAMMVFRSFSGTNMVPGDAGTSLQEAKREVFQNAVTSSYLQTLGIRLLSGRDLAESDGPGSEPVGLINRSGAEKFWPGQNPIGRCVRAVRESPTKCTRIVGVVEDTRRMELIEAKGIQFIMPWSQVAWSSSPFLVVRAKTGRRGQVLDEVRRTLADQAPSATQIEIGPLADDFERLTSQWVRSGQLLTGFGLLAALVTFFGIYGSLTYDLLRRRRELGIRLALGARPDQLVVGVVRRGLLWSLSGAGMGLIGAIWLAFAVRAMLFATEPWDVESLVVATGLVLLVGTAAAWLGARRAAVRDPSFLLRNAR